MIYRHVIITCLFSSVKGEQLQNEDKFHLPGRKIYLRSINWINNVELTTKFVVYV